MRLKVLAVGAVVAGVAALGTAALQAQEPRRAPRGDFKAMQSEIGLSDQQVSQIRAIRTAEQKESIRRYADLRIAHMELRELLAADEPDETAVTRQVRLIGDLQTQSLKARTDSQLAIRRLVTPEQYQKMQQARRQMRDGARGPRAMRRGGPEGWGFRGPGPDGRRPNGPGPNGPAPQDDDDSPLELN